MFKRSVIVVIATGVAAAVLILTQTAGSDKSQGGNKLEGAWIAKSTNSPVQGSYVLTPDPSGRQASISGSLQVQIPSSVLFPGLFGDVESSSAFVGQAVMTGPATAAYSIVGYGLKALNPPTPFLEQVVLIWVDSGEIKFLAADKLLVKHRVAYYHPDADADGDGLPDPGQAPLVCVPAATIDTRVGVMPACQP